MIGVTVDCCCVTANSETVSNETIGVGATVDSATVNSNATVEVQRLTT